MQQINELEGLPKRVLNNTTTASSTEPETYFEVKGVNDSIEPQVLTTRNPNPALDSYYKRINEEANSSDARKRKPVSEASSSLRPPSRPRHN